jgi:rfaE bifunctional protein nucleotidyltransferase chain/domain
MIVLAHGCFDCLHIGHVKHLIAAKSLGLKLVVSVSVDDAVNKGPGRPVFPLAERCMMLEQLRCVDAVFTAKCAEDAIGYIRPQIYVKGIEYATKPCPEAELVRQLGGRVVFLDTKPVYSSTAILEGRMLHGQGFAGLG